MYEYVKKQQVKCTGFWKTKIEIALFCVPIIAHILSSEA